MPPGQSQSPGASAGGDADTQFSWHLAAGWVWLLVGLGALLGLGCELFYVNDHFSGRLERMNTVFKVQLQIWFLWSTATAAALYLGWTSLRRFCGLPARAAIAAGVALLLAAGMLYPGAGTFVRTGGFQKQASLDALQGLRVHYPEDYKAVFWLRRNITGLPVILESQENAYAWHGRFATFAGLPTVLGWANHEAGWRNDWDAVLARARAVDTIYRSRDPDAARKLLEQYNVEYVITGELEHRKYAPEALSKFYSFMDPVYAEEKVQIFRRRS